MKIACWSGPRNLSTAMMYSFGARPDFDVMDEPFYAAYLARCGLDHPMAAEIMAHHECDPERVAEACAKEPSHSLYMKHMPHHMLEGFPLDWAQDCVNVHLLRHPARVIQSYALKHADVTADLLGLSQQKRLFGVLGGVLIDTSELRDNPERGLRILCDAIDLPFDAAMLSWPAGGHAQDGIWARHWYGAVHGSTGFAGPEGPLPEVGPNYREVLDEALPIYEELRQNALRL